MKVISPREALDSARSNLGLRTVGTPTDDELLAAVLRRAASLHCPCSPSTLRLVATECLRGLLDSTFDQERIELLIEQMLSCGDMLELARVATVVGSPPGTWLFLAPPSFIELESTRFHLFGLAPEDPLPLPEAIRGRVVHSGVTRIVQAKQGEDLKAQLLACGLREVLLDDFLLTPSPCAASEYIGQLAAALVKQQPCGPIEDLMVFNSLDSGKKYKDCWVPPAGLSGRYVARRPQAYGAPRWAFVEVESGEPKRLVDLPLPGHRFRGCDSAWRLQLALDQVAGRPREVQLRSHTGTVRASLFFPLPLWAQRRLDLVGRRLADPAALLTYELPAAAIERESDFLRRNLWLRIDG